MLTPAAFVSCQKYGKQLPSPHSLHHKFCKMHPEMVNRCFSGKTNAKVTSDKHVEAERGP